MVHLLFADKYLLGLQCLQVKSFIEYKQFQVIDCSFVFTEKMIRSMNKEKAEMQWGSGYQNLLQ